MKIQEWVLIDSRDGRTVLWANDERTLLDKAKDYTINGGATYYTAKIQSKVSHVKTPVIDNFGE